MTRIDSTRNVARLVDDLTSKHHATPENWPSQLISVR
jgi:hypothetical protein